MNALIGNKYGMLTVLQTSSNGKHTMCTCRCDCGVVKNVRKSHLTGGGTSSCGCNRLKSITKKSTKHGLSKSAEYVALSDARNRCVNFSHAAYSDYGGRGVRFNFPSVYAALVYVMMELGPRPDGMSLDRIDVNGNYESGNLRWADWSTQRKNQRSH